jgi:hypothetical protein
MAITPIDLQMLFSQIDKIGKEVAAQKEGAALHSVMQTDHRQKINEEKMKSVREADDSGEGPDRLKDKRNSGEKETRPDRKRNNNNNKLAADGSLFKLPEVHDPNLGNYLDISG